jgi:hypothetical protein
MFAFTSDIVTRHDDIESAQNDRDQAETNYKNCPQFSKEKNLRTPRSVFRDLATHKKVQRNRKSIHEI